MEKKFAKPELLIIEFANEDVILTSNFGLDGDIWPIVGEDEGNPSTLWW